MSAALRRGGAWSVVSFKGGAAGKPGLVGQTAMFKIGIANVRIAGQILGEQTHLRTVFTHALLADFLKTVGAMEQHTTSSTGSRNTSHVSSGTRTSAKLFTSQ
jgi:hypothetical protein